MQYIDAEPAENMLENAYVPNGLDRNAIITYNVIAFTCCMHAIFTTAELYPDPLYDPPLMNWWEKHGKEIFMLLVTAMLIAASIVSSCLFPPAAGGALFGATKTIGSILVGMVTTGAKAALSGMIVGGIMGGLSAALYGGDVWDEIASSALSGALSGFIVAVAIYAISTIVSTAVQAIRAANAARRAAKVCTQMPPNNGAIPGTEQTIELQPGVYGRYGNIGAKSNYITKGGASPSELSLPPWNNGVYTEIIVLKPIPNVVQSTVAPWAIWDGIGGGIQYVLPKSIIKLKALGYLTF